MESWEGRPEQSDLPGQGGRSANQSFEEVARAFSLKREDTTPNPPFTDLERVFEEEAPSSAQRRLAYDFYNGITSLIRSSVTLPTPLDIVELHQLHLKAIRASLGEGEIVPEYNLRHVIGARERFLAYAEAGEAQPEESDIIHHNLQSLLKAAARLEAIDYPIVTRQDAVTIQQNLLEEARAFLGKTRPYYLPELIEGRILDLGPVPFFPEEHPNQFARNGALGCVTVLESRLHGRRLAPYKPFGVKETIAIATDFGRDDLVRYTLQNVYGASRCHPECCVTTSCETRLL